jgi:hypothetical protein
MNNQSDPVLIAAMAARTLYNYTVTKENVMPIHQRKIARQK